MEIFLILQLIFSCVLCVYLIKLNRRQNKPQTPHFTHEKSTEAEEINRMRNIHLNVPLNERVRPASFSQLIGQKAAVDALCAILCGPNPQHVILYGPPGVGKTCAARLALQEAKKKPNSAFAMNAPFVEVDATCVRFDERSIADPLIGSVHDPIYQGAGALGQQGIPQPKIGAVSRAHGGILFLDEIGELPPVQMNKLLKVLEDRHVKLESAYYNPSDTTTPAYIHDIFQKGLPADFRLIGATTRSPEELPPALRSRCMEVVFRGLTRQETALIAQNAAKAIPIELNEGDANFIGSYAQGGRDAANLVQLACSMAQSQGRAKIQREDITYILRSGTYTPRYDFHLPYGKAVGRIHGLAVAGTQEGIVLPIEALVFPHEGVQIAKWEVTGIVLEEELGMDGHKLHRPSMAASSAQAVRSALRHLGIAVEKYDIHIHFSGGIPVDGPSAGLAMALCVYSAIENLPLEQNVCVTGELNLRGEVLPVGGVPAKVEGALRSGAACVLIPAQNAENDRIHEENKGAYVLAVHTLKEAITLLFPSAYPSVQNQKTLASASTL